MPQARLQVPQHREHPPVVLRGGREVELGEDRGDVLLDRALGDHERRGDRGVGAALGHQPEHLALARGQRLERVLAAAAAEQQRDDLGVERRAAAGDAADGVGEGVDVGDAVLEQVAGALRRLRQQLERVGLLDVLREHEHADAGVLGADLVRRAQPLVGVRGRHRARRRRRRRDGARRPCAAGPRRLRTGRRPRSPSPRAGARDPRAAARSRRPARRVPGRSWRERLVGLYRSSWMRAPESSAFGTKPRAPERATSGPKSDESRLETSTIVGPVAVGRGARRRRSRRCRAAARRAARDRAAGGVPRRSRTCRRPPRR